MVLGLGLFAFFERNTSKVEWVIVQMLPAFGVDFMMSTNLAAVQADLSEELTAASAAAFAFMRAYGSILGVAIPAAVFNSLFTTESYRIANESVRAELSGDRAYSFVTATLVNGLAPDTRDQVIDVFTRGLKVAWLASIAPAVLGFLIVFAEKEIVLRTELDIKYGLDDGEKVSDTEARIATAGDGVSTVQTEKRARWGLRYNVFEIGQSSIISHLYIQNNFTLRIPLH
ncbi:uncharacterized protein JN550_006539 [Neoarthrinium moseri]|uniref:uncharacterized protein n=1 Tax=Neoarthrinium moseri TaxID=1658444 RepID=UPI001FDB1E5B|nr:uncharacterized protein JN550_006539 [Neoarthrinium moseri]KAI1868051.1 hypothetical protein JN550_006539 [Neoarthrinium moseri]